MNKNTDSYPSLPYNIVYYDQDHLPEYWHAEMELYVMLAGSAKVIAGNQSFHVECEDVFLINPNEVREISGTFWEAASLTFRPELFPKEPGSRVPRFFVCSSENTFDTRYDYMRYCFANLVLIARKKKQLYNSLSIFYALYGHLLANFALPPSPGYEGGMHNSERLMSIMQYINQHYSENLSLVQTASAFGLSSPYFSSYFKKNAGKTFFDYYNDVRLSHAVKDLLFSERSIESIAQNNGFSDARSFTSIFKKKYDALPNAYRKQNKLSDSSNSKKTDLATVHAQLSHEPSSINSLLKYASVFRENTDFLTALTDNPRIMDAGIVSILDSEMQLTHNYHNMICVGSAKQFLYKEVQDMLIRAQQEIGFHYVKFHGLLSDDMMVYSEDAAGNPHYSFTFVDKAIDFLLSVHIRPLCQLSFMPIALSSDPSRLMDFYHYNTAPPKSLKKWCDLVEATVRHFIARYGLAEVKTWLFCVWNEPDETVEQFSWEDRNLFFDFYKSTYRTVKKVCPELRFGTPSLLISVQNETGWAGDFFRFLHENGCEPDFFNIHYYDNSMFEEDTSDRVRGSRGYLLENMEHSFPLNVDPYAFAKFINNMKTLLRKHNMKNLPIYLTEWNLTISHRDLINDTCFKSCHLVKNLLENYDRLSSFSYWSLTDYIEELQISDQLYHGGLGLFTFNGIPKANYNAFLLLGKLGDELVKKGDGYFITKSEGRIVIMLYNYEHYSTLFAKGQRTELNSTDRYSPFEDMSTAQFTVRLTDITGNEVLIKEFYVNQYAGSSYDIWAQMGSRSDLSIEELELLQDHSSPGFYLHRQNVEDGTLTLHLRMAPLEVRVVEISML